MKFTGTVENAPRYNDEQRFEKQSKREYLRAQKDLRALRKGKKNRWSETNEWWGLFR